MIPIPFHSYRERADLWLRDADRRWQAGQTASAIAAAQEARDGINALLATMQGTVRMQAFAVTREAQR